MAKTATLVRRWCCANCGSIRIDALWPAYVESRVNVEAFPGLQAHDHWFDAHVTDEWTPHGGSLQCRDCASNSDPIPRLMTEDEWEAKKKRARAADAVEREQHGWVGDAVDADDQTGLFPDSGAYSGLILGPLRRDEADAGIAPGCTAGPDGCVLRKPYDRIGPTEARHRYGCPNEKR